VRKHDLFVGIDWGTQTHAVCVLDGARKVIAERRVEHLGDAVIELAGWLAKLSGSDASRVAVAIEVPRGPLVEALVERGLDVYAINPKQLDRFRDRHTVAGAKDDRKDAFVLADSLRTDMECFRRVATDEPLVIRIRELSRVQADLEADFRRQANRLREQVLRAWPQLLGLCQGADEPWFWAAVELMVQRKPTRPAAIRALLAQHRIRRIAAADLVAAMRATPLPSAAGTVDAVISHIQLLLPQLRVLQQQIRRCDTQISELLDEFVQGHNSEHRDVPVLRSLPGVGNKVAVTMLAEAAQPLAKRDYQMLRTLGGCAPVTRASGTRSGKRAPVLMRQACNARLREALFHWARTSVQHDVSTRDYYAALRQRGHGHARALRSVADRNLRILVAMLNNQTEYDPERARARQKAA
jgi:transposase